jgi:hypothetical protein
MQIKGTINYKIEEHLERAKGRIEAACFILGMENYILVQDHIEEARHQLRLAAATCGTAREQHNDKKQN